MLDVMYRNGRQRVTRLAGRLGDEQFQTAVPATPGWTVHDVLAHLAGGAADLASGRLDGAPADEWTARHVAERRNFSTGELFAEWDRVAPAVESSLATASFSGPNLAGDVIGHEADLCEALGLSRPDRAHWQPVLEFMMLLLGKRLSGDTSLVIRDEQGNEWRFGSGKHGTLLRADGYELLRGAYSRRSQRQIAAWYWNPTPDTDVIACFGFFGPRDDDQPIPIG